VKSIKVTCLGLVGSKESSLCKDWTQDIPVNLIMAVGVSSDGGSWIELLGGLGWECLYCRESVVEVQNQIDEARGVTHVSY
jgi:hypothetical protein